MNFNFDGENCIATYTQKILTEVVSKENEATIKAIERYCEENGYIPHIIEKEKLELILKLGIYEYQKQSGDDK